MKHVLLAALAAVALAGAASAQGINQPATQPFKDVPRDHWAYEAVEHLRQLGIVNGYPDGSFRGKRTVTRYEAASGLNKAARVYNAGLPEDAFVSNIPGPQGARGPQGPQGPAGTPPPELKQLRAILEQMRQELHDMNDQLGAASSRAERLDAETKGHKKSATPVGH